MDRFSEYLMNVAYYYVNNKEQRFGQAATNTLYSMYPNIYADCIEIADVFFDDELVPEFLMVVRDFLEV